jgi:hypothetical protein
MEDPIGILLAGPFRPGVCGPTGPVYGDYHSPSEFLTPADNLQPVLSTKAGAVVENDDIAVVNTGSCK